MWDNLRKLWRGLVWGSLEGPAIQINWEEHNITCLRMSDRQDCAMGCQR